MIKRFSIFGSVCLVLGMAFMWQLRVFQLPIVSSDIPQWRVSELNSYEWHIYAEGQPERFTQAWVRRNPRNLHCDTVVLLGGLEEGENLVSGGDHLRDRANIVALRHPLSQRAQSRPIEDWGLYDWLNSPFSLKKEILHTVGALQAVLDYILLQSSSEGIFTDQVVLAGGSFGGPFPVILTSFQPDKVAALMVIYGFTNYELVIRRELIRQGYIHFGLDPSSTGVWSSLKFLFVDAVAHATSFVLGQMFKYGEMELYFPKVRDTPIYFINGRDDHIVPMESFKPMWDSAPHPKYQEWVDGDHIDPGSPQELNLLVSRLFKWNQSQNLWQCKQKPINSTEELPSSMITIE